MVQYEYVFEHNFKLYARLFNSDTKHSKTLEIDKTKYIPPLYIPNVSGEYKSFTTQERLSKVTFKKVADVTAYVNQYKNSNINLYGNRSYVQEFIRTKFANTVDSNHTMRTHFIDIETSSTNGFPDFKNPIERITLFQVYDTFDQKYYVIGEKPYNNNKSYDFGDVEYIQCKNEYDMCEKFINLIEDKDPTIVIGFNTFAFDFPYITERLQKIGHTASRLSPIKMFSTKESKNFENFDYTFYDWHGRIMMDYREIYLKYTFNKLPRWNLETICTAEIGEGKVEHNEYSTFDEFYAKDFQKYVEYGIKDVELLLKLDKQVKMIDTAKYIAYVCGVNIPDVMGTYKQWHSIVYNTCIKNNIVLPLKAQYTNPNDVYVGGWVKSTPSKTGWTASFDFSSLYPSVIRFLNLGVDTLVKPEELHDDLKYLHSKYFGTYYKKSDEKEIKAVNNNSKEIEYFKMLIDNKEEIHTILDKHNVCASPNGYFYKKDTQSVPSRMMELFYNQRVEAKNEIKKYEALLNEVSDGMNTDYVSKIEYYDLQQYVLKILINSFYGAAALDMNVFSHGKGFASAVTTGGRMANRLVAYNISKTFNDNLKLYNDTTILPTVPYITQADTDSVYISIDSIINKKCNTDDAIDRKITVATNICNKLIYPIINSTLDELAYTLNAKDRDVMKMEQEIIADKFISIADKRYYARYFKFDKHTKTYKPKYKITGLSLISKSTPPWCKTNLTPILDIILDQDENSLINYVEQSKAKFVQVNVEEVSPIKGVTSIDYTMTGDKFYQYKDGKELTAPIHSRGAILHNMLVDELKIPYEKIKNGDKIYYTYLITPNPVYNQNIISYIDPNFIIDAGLTEYIDYETMFEKNFLSNIQLITDPIKWSLSKSTVDMQCWF